MFKILAMTALVVTACSAMANETITAANNQISVDAGVQNVAYHELDKTGTLGGGYLDSEAGAQFTVGLSGSYQGNVAGIKDLYVKMSGRLSDGRTNYDGYLEGDGAMTPYKNWTAAKTVDYSLRVGKGFELGADGNCQVTPYLEYGYHSWDRDSSHSEYGYDERYRHDYAAIGVLAQHDFGAGITAALDITEGKMFGAGLNVPIAGYYPLGTQQVTSVEFSVDYRLTNHVHLHGGLGETRFGYSMSPVMANGSFEPDSSSRVITTTVGAGYQF